MTMMGVLPPRKLLGTQSSEKEEDLSFQDRAEHSMRRSEQAMQDLQYGFSPYHSAHAGMRNLNFIMKP